MLTEILASPLSFTIGIIFLVSLVIYLLISLIIYLRPFLRNRKDSKSSVIDDEGLPGVSVVVYSYNQADYLVRNIPVLLDNEYPEFEIIVVDDASNDETEDVLTLMEQRSDSFYHTRVNADVRTVSRRKLAVLLGVKAARHEIVLLTQAQCIPASKHWIRSMVNHFTPKTGIVLGPVVLEDRVGVMSKFYAFDYFHRMLKLLGTTLCVGPYSGSGMNMGFRKSLFFENDGFRKHLNLIPGEDDLFVRDSGTRDNTIVSCASDAVMISQEHPAAYGWRQLRLSRGFTSRFYPLLPGVIHVLDALSRYLFVFTGFALLFFLWDNWLIFSIVAGLLLFRAIYQVILYYMTAKRMKVHRYVFSILAFELIIPLVDLYFFLYGILRKKGFEVGRI